MRFLMVKIVSLHSWKQMTEYISLHGNLTIIVVISECPKMSQEVNLLHSKVSDQKTINLIIKLCRLFHVKFTIVEVVIG